MNIEFRRFADMDVDAWSSFVDECDEAWFYHTPEFIQSFPYDHSFGILIDGALEGVCALGRVSRRRGAYLVGPGAALSVVARSMQVYQSLKEKLIVEANSANCQGVEFTLSPMAPANVDRNFEGSVLDHCNFSRGGRWRRAWELSPGYFSVIDLAKDLQEIRRGFSKGNKASVTRCDKLGMALQVCSGPSSDKAAWQDFLAIHGATCRRRGDPPYTSERYEHLFGLLKSGHMTLMNGMLNGRCATSILLATYKTAAFYSYGGAFDAARKKGAMAWAQSEAIRWLKEGGYRRYCLGFTIAVLEGTYEGGVGDFKKRFGGERWLMLCGELVSNPAAYFVRQILPDFFRFCVLNPLGLRKPAPAPLSNSTSPDVP